MTIDYCDSKLSGTNDSVVLKYGYFTPISFNTSINTSWVSSYLIREDCMPTCLMNCDCLGYEFLPNQTGCRYWSIHHSCFHEDPTISTICFVLPRKIRHITKRTNDGNHGMHRWMKIGISVAIVLLALVLCSMCYLIRRRKLAGENQKKIQDLLNMMNSNRHILNDGNRGHDLCVFKYASILAATRNFSDENKLGQGGFGSVYKGRLVTGEEVAIKRLSKCSKQGISEFKNELILIYELQHKNLVQLFGFCIHGEEKMLIYEYLPNKSLDYFLFDASRCAQLDWNKRFSIIEGIAQGLLYLHIYSRTRIVHRDLKASNVLLDERMQPKISDFGLARIFSNDEEEANTLIIAGTRAYMPPEYIIGGNFSTKSDVYSFGVLMLEILSGRKNNSFYNNDRALNLVGYAWMLWKQDAGLGLVDPTIGDSCNEEKSLRCIQVALLCVEENPADRPTMLDVMSMLTNESMTLPTPTKPAFCTERNVTSAAAVNGIRQEIVVSVNKLARSCRHLSALKQLELPSHIPILTPRTPQNPNPTSPQCLSNHPNPEISCFPQKGFSQITHISSAKSLHALCLKRLIPLRPFSINTLILVYSKFNRIGYARRVFDEMPERNEASWSTMMSGYVRVGLHCDAVRLFVEMFGCGVRPSGFVVASLVAACDKDGGLFNEGRQVHGVVVKFGLLLCDVYAGTSVVHFYGRYGDVESARRVFEEMPERNVVTWTSLAVAYSSVGDYKGVMSVYKSVKREGVCCNINENSLANVFSTCGAMGDEFFGRQVLGDAVKLGLMIFVSIGNSLVAMYGGFGDVGEACYVFDHMDGRDTISWNSIINANVQNGRCEEALWYFHRMRYVNEVVNSITVSTMLGVCGSRDNLKWGRGIHGLSVKQGIESDVCFGNTLLSMYSEAGRSEDAELVFERMVEKDVVSWNSLLACYVQNEESQSALKHFAEMLRQRKPINFVTLTSALSACSNPEFIVAGKIIHAIAVVGGLQDHLVVGNALVTMYGKHSNTVEAAKVLQTMPKRSEVTWNSLIGSYAENREPDQAITAFKLMRLEGDPASYITIINVLGAFLGPSDLLIHGMPIHAHIVKTGFESENYVPSSLITMYAKCGDLNSSNCIFNGLTVRNSYAWNAIIAANANHGLEEALKLLLEMRRAGLDFDQFSLSVTLSVSADLAMLVEGQQLHGLVVKLGFDTDPFITNSAMDMYGKCGEIEDVLKMLPSPTIRSRLSWNILISSFAKHGCFENARESFHDMVSLGVKPNHVTFVSLLSACSHGGLVDDGLAYYNAMTTEFDVPPAIDHCVCVIDLLGRAGRLSEAETFIKEMPVPPNDFVWRSLLSACKTHRNLELGRKAAKHLLELDPSDDSAYVLFSNVCASTGRWEEVENIRKQMGARSITKKQACSWVKSKSEVCKFGMGENSHPQTDQIYAKLGELMKLITEAGYVPDTSYSLQDTDEEQKEQNLWNHSERIALAFGLISTPEGSPIKVFKNLRVCGDCHSVYKHASAVVKRKIILRDPYRFHHFSNGKCSCSDYW